jgi:SAM-dependent methyltransferase
MPAKKEKIRSAILKDYGQIATRNENGCGCGCGPEDNPALDEVAKKLGYSSKDLTSVPQGSNMGLGCGNPQIIASLKPGETVLDLGSGAGFDCFLASKAVGDDGLVIGVDMTPEMIARARANAAKGNYKNIEFRLGEMENLPVANDSVDVIISNCVINLSTDKSKVHNEAYRVLKRGGRLAVTDIVTTVTLPEEVQNDLALYTGCVAGALRIDQVESLLVEAGFKDITVKPIDRDKKVITMWSEGNDISDYIISVTIEALKQ